MYPDHGPDPWGRSGPIPQILDGLLSCLGDRVLVRCGRQDPSCILHDRSSCLLAGIPSSSMRRPRCAWRGPRVRRGPRRPRRADRRRHARLCRRARPRRHPRPRRAGRRGADVLRRAGDAAGTAGLWPNGWSRPAARSAPKRLPRAPPSTRTSRASWPYFAPVADLPGFPRAVARTLSELQLAGVDAAALGRVPDVGGDLATLLARAQVEADRAGAVSRAEAIATAARRLQGRSRRPAGARRAAPRRAGGHRRRERPARRRSSARRRDLIATVPLGDARHSRRPRAMRRGRRRRRSEPATARRSGDRARSPAHVALRLRRAAGGRRRRHGARVLGPGRGPRSRRDRAPRAAGGGARRAVRRDGGAAAGAADLPRPARARLRPRRRPGVVRARHAPPRSRRPRLPGAARLRRREPVGAPLRRVSVPRPGAASGGGTGPSGTELSPAPVTDFDRRRSSCHSAPRRPARGPRADRRGATGQRARPRRSRRRRHAARTVALGGAAGRGLRHRGPRPLAAAAAGPARRVRAPAQGARRRGPGLAAPARPGPRSRRAAPPGVVRAADRRRARQLGQRPQLGRVAHRLRGAGAARAAAAGPRAARARRDGAARPASGR